MLILPRTFDGARTIPSPEVTDLMLALLDLKPEDRVMEVGTGSAYQTNRFAETGAMIHSIELEPFVDSTKIAGGCVYLHYGNAYVGLPGYPPFTAVVATCGIEDIPRSWIDQLADDGRMVVPIGDERSQRLTLFRNEKGELVPKRIAAYVRFQMMREVPKREPIKPVYKVRPDAVE